MREITKKKGILKSQCDHSGIRCCKLDPMYESRRYDKGITGLQNSGLGALTMLQSACGYIGDLIVIMIMGHLRNGAVGAKINMIPRCRCMVMLQCDQIGHFSHLTAILSQMFAQCNVLDKMQYLKDNMHLNRDKDLL